MDKEALLKPRLPETEVDIDGVGTIRVRALTREEAIQVGDLKSTLDRERRMLTMAMVQPAMTIQDVQQWQRISPAAELEKVTTVIARISGMLPEEAKEATERFPEEPGS